MKLSELQAAVAQDEEALTFSLIDPMGDTYTASDGSDVTWSVVGQQAKAYRDAENREFRRQRRERTTDVDAETLRTQRIALAVAGSTAFTGFEDESGAPLPFSVNAAKAILGADVRLLVQVETKIREHSAFLSKRSTSSSAT